MALPSLFARDLSEMRFNMMSCRTVFPRLAMAICRRCTSRRRSPSSRPRRVELSSVCTNAPNIDADVHLFMKMPSVEMIDRCKELP